MDEQNPSLQCDSIGTPAVLAHVVPASALVLVFLALIVLTGITVGVSYFDLGALNLFVALSVATVKAALVGLWFMHLRYESPLYAILLFAAIVFLGLFSGITILDSVQYNPEIEQWQQQHAR